jgi:NifU-like protein
MWKYSEILMDHFMNPRNAGKLEKPDGHSEIGSPQCGDAMTLDIKVDDDDRIIDIKFMTFGCAGAIAAASALTEMAKGMTLEDAGGIRNKQIVEFLGGMPAEKYHCSVMGHDALTEAIDYFTTRRDETRNNLKAIISNMPAELERVMRNNTITIEHVRPERVLISLLNEDTQKIVVILEKELHKRLGRTVEVKVAG